MGIFPCLHTYLYSDRSTDVLPLTWLGGLNYIMPVKQALWQLLYKFPSNQTLAFSSVEKISATVQSVVLQYFSCHFGQIFLEPYSWLLAVIDFCSKYVVFLETKSHMLLRLISLSLYSFINYSFHDILSHSLITQRSFYSYH